MFFAPKKYLITFLNCCNYRKFVKMSLRYHIFIDLSDVEISMNIDLNIVD